MAVYIALVRPTLEYCSAIWDPYTQELTQNVGKIQRRAARLVHNNYDWQTSASGLIRDLEWDMLSTRRKISRLKYSSSQSHWGTPCTAVRPRGKPAAHTAVHSLNIKQGLKRTNFHLYPQL